MAVPDLGMLAGMSCSKSLPCCSHLSTESCNSKPKFLIIGEGLEVLVISLRRFSGICVAQDSFRISVVSSKAFSAP